MSKAIGSASAASQYSWSGDQRLQVGADPHPKKEKREVIGQFISYMESLSCSISSSGMLKERVKNTDHWRVA